MAACRRFYYSIRCAYDSVRTAVDLFIRARCRNRACFLCAGICHICGSQQYFYVLVFGIMRCIQRCRLYKIYIYSGDIAFMDFQNSLDFTVSACYELGHHRNMDRNDCKQYYGMYRSTMDVYSRKLAEQYDIEYRDRIGSTNTTECLLSSKLFLLKCVLFKRNNVSRAFYE